MQQTAAAAAAAAAAALAASCALHPLVGAEPRSTASRLSSGVKTLVTGSCAFKVATKCTFKRPTQRYQTQAGCFRGSCEEIQGETLCHRGSWQDNECRWTVFRKKFGFVELPPHPHILVGPTAVTTRPATSIGFNLLPLHSKMAYTHLEFKNIGYICQDE
jgi:hypothetical protein